MYANERRCREGAYCLRLSPTLQGGWIFLRRLLIVAAKQRFGTMGWYALVEGR